MGDERYEQVPYPGHPYAYTHPVRLATVAHLLGLTPPAVQGANVLELGCGDGLNLIGMGAALPDATFVGVDGSPSAIARGRACAEAVGVSNVTLHAGDIETISHESDRFDYIIAHGVFSWVPEPVQEALLDVIGRLLTDAGVAYVSYNTYPDWHVRSLARTVMREYSRHFADPGEQIRRAREIMDVMGRRGDTGGVYNRALGAVARRVERCSDAYLFHDYLAPVNIPIYFRDFMARASRRGLRYLGEAEPWDMMGVHLEPELRAFLDVADDPVEREQLLDAMVGRGFRRTLLVRDHHDVAPVLQPHRVADLYIVARGECDGELDLDPGQDATFHTVTGTEVVVRTPFTKAAMAILGERVPAAMRVRDLHALAAERITDEVPDLLAWGDILIELFGARLVELRAAPTLAPAELSERPEASPLARWQVLQGEEHVTSADHFAVALGALARVVLVYADGTRDHDALLSCVMTHVRRGELDATIDGEQLSGSPRLAELLSQKVTEALEFLRRASLLASPT